MVYRKGDGFLPNRPQDEQVIKRGLDNRMWELLCECCSKNPEDRPSIDELVMKLSERYIAMHEPIESLFVAKSEMDRSRSLNKVELHILMSSSIAHRISPALR